MDLTIPRRLIELGVSAMAILASTVAVVLVSAPPSSAFVVTAVFPPWWSAAEIRQAVTPIGVAASVGRTGNIVTIYGGVDLQARLQRAGAWLILDPRLLNCGPSPERN
ncbi:hypothetical protein [Brevundimonas variabilis]|uniref:Uncharacterized protein n=1 Tax=Brevundimonas variabilis TaxID=74312 RepID=A0A7W9FHG9_9CAUL|nr:hypothetical protein [Brevundimonas variabilis]MBB5747688.1 hypothetical protein [Brevundimonas variabilis]